MGTRVHLLCECCHEIEQELARLADRLKAATINRLPDEEWAFTVVRILNLKEALATARSKILINVLEFLVGAALK